MSPRIRLAAFACPLALVLPGVVHAQDRATAATPQTVGRQQIEVAATAAPACSISTGNAVGSQNASFQSAGTSGGTVAITAFADPETAQANPASVQVEIPVICNSAHAVSIRSANGGMLRTGGTTTAMGGFIQFLPYAVQLDWVGQSLSGQSDNQGALSMRVPNPGQGLLTVDIAIAPGQAPLVAGAYADTLQIEITAAN